MTKSNTPEQSHFFRTLASGDLQQIRASVVGAAELLDSFDYRSFGATPLTTACYSNRPAVVELLIDLGADPNKRSDWQMGPWSPLHCAIYRRDRTLAIYLLSRGATMDVHTAAGLGDCDAVSRLLDAAPARVAEKGGDGCQPLHFADTIDVAKLLLERGAEIDARCTDHYSTPLQYLCTTRPEVARNLLSAGALPDIFSVIACGDQRAIENLLDADPNLIHARINQEFFPPGKEHNVHNVLNFSIGTDSTPMHAAARTNQGEAIAQLVRRGLSANVRGGYDHGTPLHTAAWHHCVQAAETLLDHGADLEARSGKLHNNTPAGWAIVAGASEVFELLLDRGAQCHPWFVDDARYACAGRFDQVSNTSPENRQRILTRLSS